MPNQIVYRLYEEEGVERMSTAKRLKDESLLQVYPKLKRFASLDDWRAAYPQCTILNEKIHEKVAPIAVRPTISPVIRTRRNNDLMEFFEPDYLQMVQHVKIEASPEPIVHITMPDGTEWKVQPSLDFIRAPIVWKNGERYGQKYEGESYSPALTAVRWWMMLAFLDADKE
jgi:hypothetical protein